MVQVIVLEGMHRCPKCGSETHNPEAFKRDGWWCVCCVDCVNVWQAIEQDLSEEERAEHKARACHEDQ